jgi:hypothetical protein
MKNITVTAVQEKAKRNMMNTTKYKDVMQCLHVVCGYDFMKEYTILEVSGHMTYNSIMSVVPKMERPSKIVVLFVNEDYYGEGTENLYYAELHEDDKKFHRCEGTTINHYRGIDNPYSVGGMEKIRKEAYRAYVIIQDDKYLCERKRQSLDCMERLKYNIANNRNRNKAYVYLDMRGSEYDKSGYDIAIVREEYRRRTRNLKAERAKADADKYDTSAATEDIAAKIKQITDKCTEIFKNPTYEKIIAIDNISYHLRILFSYYKNHCERIKDRTYSSVGAIKTRIDLMNNEITSMNEILDRI